jgi:hypothetical protein
VGVGCGARLRADGTARPTAERRVCKQPKVGDLIEHGQTGRIGQVMGVRDHGRILTVGMMPCGVGARRERETMERAEAGHWVTYRIPEGAGRDGLVWLVLSHEATTTPVWAQQYPHKVRVALVDSGELRGDHTWHVPSVDDSAYGFVR